MASPKGPWTGPAGTLFSWTINRPSPNCGNAEALITKFSGVTIVLIDMPCRAPDGRLEADECLDSEPCPPLTLGRPLIVDGEEIGNCIAFCGFVAAGQVYFVPDDRCIGGIGCSQIRPDQSPGLEACILPTTECLQARFEEYARDNVILPPVDPENPQQPIDADDVEIPSAPALPVCQNPSYDLH